MFPSANGGSVSLPPTQLGVINVPVAISNINTEQTLLTLPVPANTMGINGRIILDLLGNNVAGLVPPTLLFKCKFGATSLTVVAPLVTLASQTGLWRMRFEIMNLGVTNSQNLTAVLSGHIATALATVAEESYYNQGTSAIDTTAIQNIVVTLTPGSVVATNTTNLLGASLQLLK